MFLGLLDDLSYYEYGVYRASFGSEAKVALTSCLLRLQLHPIEQDSAEYLSWYREERYGSVVAGIEFIALFMYGGNWHMCPVLRSSHFCHGLPTRFEDLGCDTVDAGGLLVLHFLDSLLDFL